MYEIQGSETKSPSAQTLCALRRIFRGATQLDASCGKVISFITYP